MKGKFVTDNTKESTCGCNLYVICIDDAGSVNLRISRADDSTLKREGCNGCIHFAVTNIFEEVIDREGYLHLKRESVIEYPDLKDVVPEILQYLFGDRNYPYEFVIALF